jgi:hypothetical protein
MNQQGRLGLERMCGELLVSSATGYHPGRVPRLREIGVMMIDIGDNTRIFILRQVISF